MDLLRGLRRGRHLAFIGGAVFLGAVFVLFAAGRIGPGASVVVERDGETSGMETTLEEVVQHGQERWTQLRAEGVDLTNGPCLDDAETYPGWAIDLVREARIDHLPENQCASYSSGRVTRLVELSLDGNIVRVEPEWLWDSGTTELP